MTIFLKQFMRWGLPLWTIVILAQSGCKPKVLTRAEGEKALKILDSDVNRLLSAAAEADWKVAISSLAQLKGAPFPRIKHSSVDTSNLVLNNQTKWAFPTGHYTWNPRLGVFDYEPNSKAYITIDYPLIGQNTNNAQCVIRAFSNGPAGSYANIPSVFEATFSIAGKQIVTVSHQMRLEGQVPVQIHCTLKGAHFQGYFRLDNRILGRFGQVKLSAELQVRGQAVLELALNGRIKLNGGGTYSVEAAQWQARVFEMNMIGNVQYAAINPSSKNYDTDFNQHSNIILQENPSGLCVAELELGRLPNEDRFDFFLKFSDDSLQPLSNYLLSVQKFMKY
jgi:hypothetical protein